MHRLIGFLAGFILIDSFVLSLANNKQKRGEKKRHPFKNVHDEIVNRENETFLVFALNSGNG